MVFEFIKNIVSNEQEMEIEMLRQNKELLEEITNCI